MLCDGLKMISSLFQTLKHFKHFFFFSFKKIETKFKLFCPSFTNLTHAFVVLITIISNKTYTYSCSPYFSALTCIPMNQLLCDYSE